MRGCQHLLSKVVQEQWPVMCRSAKRMKDLKAPHLEGRYVETRNPFSVLGGIMEEEVEVAGEGRRRYPVPR